MRSDWLDIGLLLKRLPSYARYNCRPAYGNANKSIRNQGKANTTRQPKPCATPHRGDANRPIRMQERPHPKTTNKATTQTDNQKSRKGPRPREHISTPYGQKPHLNPKIFPPAPYDFAVVIYAELSPSIKNEPNLSGTAQNSNRALKNRQIKG